MNATQLSEYETKCGLTDVASIGFWSKDAYKLKDEKQRNQ